MALTKLSANVANVQALGDKPTESATQVKVIFDKAGVDIKAFLNDTLTVEADATFATKTELADVVAGGIADGAVADVKLSNTTGQIKERVATLSTDYTTFKSVTPTLGPNRTPLISNTNMNDYVTAGNYYSTGTVASTITNCPTTSSFLMDVSYHFNTPNWVVQKLTEAYSGVHYYRIYDLQTSAWRPWVRYLTDADKGVNGTYTGDGTASRTIALGFRPKSVIVMPSYGIDHANSYTWDCGLALDGFPAQAESDAGLKNIITMTSTGFNVGHYQWVSGTTRRIGNNQSGVVYHYKADR